MLRLFHILICADSSIYVRKLIKKMASLNLVGLTTTMLPSNGTDIIVNKEMQVETVIVILWISGGILLIALIILLACILRTNKKGRRRSNPLRYG